MRIGMFLSGAAGQPVDTIVEEVRGIEAAGLHTVWIGQLYDHDALTLAAVLGREARSIGIGTWVVPTYPRHPAMLAQQALSVQDAIGGRLTLGIGLSHKVVVEKRLGLDYSRPIRHMREYLEVLRPLLHGEAVRHEGEEFRVRWQVELPHAPPPPLLVAALGPQMLRLTGRLADGVTLWLGGPRYLGEFALPTLRESASAAGRPAPRIACGLPIVVHDDVGAGRDAISTALDQIAALPSYRAVLEREGVSSPRDVGIVGSEDAVHAQLDRLEALGVDDFNAVICEVPGTPGSAQRTLELLSERARASCSQAGQG
jgi:5,10-methylenetetrahydromethanopterin reductase